MVWENVLGSVVVVSLVSLAGVFTLSLNQKRLKSILTYLVAFAAGALLGDAFIHLLPEVVEEMGFGLEVSLSVMAGILTLFIVEKVIHWRHCHIPEEAHMHHAHPFAIVNLFGDAVHNFIDGMVIAAAYLVSFPVGLATTVAVILHEIPQEIGDFGILVHGGFTVSRALLFNLLTAVTAIIGAGIVLYFGSAFQDSVTWLVPFAAGNFIYIAAADLIPELHKEVKWNKSVLQLLAVLAGIGAMVLLLGLE